MEIRRVALIYDDRARPETTGFYCRRPGVAGRGRALPARRAGGVPARASISTSTSMTGCRTICRPICARGLVGDRHAPRLRPGASKSAADRLVFAAQRDGAERLRRAGIASAAWLPLACDPEIHRRHDVAKQYDVAFVGNVFPGPRADLLELIRRTVSRSFIGKGYFEEMARTYSAARIVFNRSIRNDVNMRVFEAVACGSMLLTNDLGENGQAELFRDGVHLATYRDPEELLDKLAFYLGREAVRERIAAAGRREAMGEAYVPASDGAMLLRTPGSGRRLRGRTVRATALTVRALVWTTASAHARQVDSRSAFGFGPPASVPDPFYFGHARPEVLALVPLRPGGCWTSAAARGGWARRSRRGSRPRSSASSSMRPPPRRRGAARPGLVGDIERLDLPIPARVVRRDRLRRHPGASA